MTENDGVVPPAQNRPIERKVKAASGTALVTAFVVGLVGHYLFKGTEVPPALVALIETAIVTGATFLAGFLAKHTYRPDLPARLDDQGRRIVP